MRIALLIAGKDLRQRLRDSSAILMAIVLPLGLAGILSLTVGPAADQGLSFRYAVVDEDGGPLGKAFLTDVLGPVERDGLIEVTEAGSVDRAESMVDGGKVEAAIVVPEGFSAAVQQGGTPDLRVIGDVDEQVATTSRGRSSRGTPSSSTAPGCRPR